MHSCGLSSFLLPPGEHMHTLSPTHAAPLWLCLSLHLIRETWVSQLAGRYYCSHWQEAETGWSRLVADFCGCLRNCQSSPNLDICPFPLLSNAAEVLPQIRRLPDEWYDWVRSHGLGEKKSFWRPKRGAKKEEVLWRSHFILSFDHPIGQRGGCARWCCCILLNEGPVRTQSSCSVFRPSLSF